jgi:NitT/TauT family transport system permease protein
LAISVAGLVAGSDGVQPLMFAVLTVITVLGLTFYKICEWLERRLLGTASELSTRTSS